MERNPLLVLEGFGQSLWIDFIRRGMVTSGELQRLIEKDGVSGVTSNPSIFEKAFAEGQDYDETLRALTREGKDAAQVYQDLSVQDIQMVADRLRPTYDRTEGQDGFVSLEVSPRLAYDTDGTIAEARQLWSLVDRPNAMIKVPATREGIPAIRQLTGEGLNINITLLFGLPRYREVVNAYLAGLETFAGQGEDLKQVASVASFFLSRIDTLLDPAFETQMLAVNQKADVAARVHGQVAIASAKVAYQIYQEIFDSDRFKRLAEKGARPQRLLWASTSTKNPAYPDTKYVEPLIGPDTINTLPVETLNAYREHGNPKLTLDQNVPEAYKILAALPSLDIDLNEATDQLEKEGVEKFNTALNKLLAALKKKQADIREPVER